MQREERSYLGALFGTYGGSYQRLGRLRPIPRRLRNETLSHLRSTFRHGGAEIVKRTRRAVPTVRAYPDLASDGESPSTVPISTFCGRWVTSERHIVKQGGAK